MKKLTPKQVREAMAAANEAYYKITRPLTKKMVAAREKWQATVKEVRQACPHKNISYYNGTEYEIGVESCDDCGMDLE